MLLIGDIHINAHYQDAITTALEKYIGQHPGEKNIIFCGDFVYHFSYDRNALLSLYHLLLKLVQEGRNVYVLAGNHDRLGNSFVFEEGKKAFDIINSITHDQGKIFFITQPQYHTIEGQEILFLPFMISSNSLSSFVKEGDHEVVEDLGIPDTVQQTINILKESKNKNEVFSAHLNEYLRSEIQGKKDILIIHHYYINNVKFPGQKAKFNYKDVALHEDILKQPGIKLISGHLHQAFAHTNYVCLGGVRSTTPLEVNQNKFLRKYDTAKHILQASEIAINPYIFMERKSEAIDQEALEEEMKNISKENRKNLDSKEWNIEFIDTKIDLKTVSLSIKTDNIDYQNIDEYITPDLRKKIKDVKLKKESIELNELLKNFEISAKNLSTGFADWKDILKSYLHKKHEPDYDKYEKILKQLKLL